MVDSTVCSCSSARFTAPLSFLGVRSFMAAVRRCPLFVTIITLVLAAILSSPVSAAVVSTNVLAACPVLPCAVHGYVMPADKTFFPVHVASDFAQFWDTFYGVNFKIIHLHSTNEQYVLYQCGTDISSIVGNVTVQSINSQHDGGSDEQTVTVQIRSDAKFFSVPLKKVCIRETVSMTFMELLGVRTSIYKADTTYVASSCVNQLAKEGTILDLPWGTPDSDLNDCDAIIGGENHASPNPKVITFQSTLDPGIFNRAEYLDYLSLFFNKEAASNDIFIPIQNRFNTLTALANSQPNKIKAAWINSFSSTYYFEAARYKNDLMAFAGFEIYFPDAGSQSTFPTAQALFEQLFLNGVELLIDESYNLLDYNAFVQYYHITPTDANPLTSRYLFIKNHKVFRIDRSVSKNDADDWFESAIPNIDAVLSDFVSAAYPALTPGYTRHWVRNIAIEESKEMIIDTCANTAAATLPVLAEGSGTENFVCPAWLMDPASF